MELFFALSIEITSKVSPLVCGLVKIIEKVPSEATIPEPISLPLSLVIVIMEPTSPLPLTVVPASSNRTSLGLIGAVVSNAVTVTGVELFFALSIEITSKVSPLVCGLVKLIEKVPSLPTLPEPSSLPFASLTMTAEPTSPLPVIVVPVSLS